MGGGRSCSGLSLPRQEGDGQEPPRGKKGQAPDTHGHMWVLSIPRTQQDLPTSLQ